MNQIDNKPKLLLGEDNTIWLDTLLFELLNTNSSCSLNDYSLNKASWQIESYEKDSISFCRIPENSLMVMNVRELDTKIAQALMKLGIKPHYKGFTYLKMAIHMQILNSAISYYEVIQWVARSYNTTVCNVDRVMRYAIEVAWNSQMYYDGEMCFGKMDMRPTNKEFIHHIKEQLMLRMSDY